MSQKRATLNWHTHLLPNSIDLLIMLMEKFKVQYTGPHHLTSIALVNLRQEEDESLHSFMERFSTVAVKIMDLNLECFNNIMIGHKSFIQELACQRLQALIDEYHTTPTRKPKHHGMPTVKCIN
ncbi:hypothetical protein CR513_47609, partial [Mucuna pruriens]